jgi:uncharacterized protein (TIGR00661 family)
MSQQPLHILISPLDWGLGHAARCIPVIKHLVDAGHKVTIAGHGRSILLLAKEFPHINCADLPGFSPTYSRLGNMVLRLLMLLPQFLYSIINEHRILKRLISHNNFDIIISDNRYGLWNKNVKSILITHQVMIKTPPWLGFAEYPLFRISRLLISRFDECWIPDYEESPGLSGDLSHKYPLPDNCFFMGPLSRFQSSDLPKESNSGQKKIVVIISGPEPQRSIFEESVTKQLKGLNLPAILVSGKPEIEKNKFIMENLTIIPHLLMDELYSVLTSASIVICRSGYSTIMDLHALGLKALFVPTPGQTEQLYLAKLHHQVGSTYWQTQEKLNLDKDIDEAKKYPGFLKNSSKPGLMTAILGLKKK